MRDAIVIVAKHPEPGRVKTRLCPPLTPCQAADLAEAFVLDTLEAALAVHNAEIFIGYAPNTESARAWFENVAPAHELLPQGEGDLGNRLTSLLQKCFWRRFDRVVLIGSDMPQIDPSVIRNALDMVGSSADVAIGPAEDGGYYLIALKELHERLFRDMPWGGSMLLETTLAAAAKANLSVGLLPTGRDVDASEDLVALEAHDAKSLVHTNLVLRRVRGLDHP